MKTILEEAMITYVAEMDKVCDQIKDSYSKAVRAVHRGDELNYQKHSNTITELGSKLEEMKKEFNKIEAAYAAI